MSVVAIATSASASFLLFLSVVRIEFLYNKTVLVNQPFLPIGTNLDQKKKRSLCGDIVVFSFLFIFDFTASRSCADAANIVAIVSERSMHRRRIVETHRHDGIVTNLLRNRASVAER